MNSTQVKFKYFSVFIKVSVNFAIHSNKKSPYFNMGYLL